MNVRKIIWVTLGSLEKGPPAVLCGLVFLSKICLLHLVRIQKCPLGHCFVVTIFLLYWTGSRPRTDKPFPSCSVTVTFAIGFKESWLSVAKSLSPARHLVSLLCVLFNALENLRWETFPLLFKETESQCGSMNPKTTQLGSSRKVFCFLCFPLILLSKPLELAVLIKNGS